MGEIAEMDIEFCQCGNVLEEWERPGPCETCEYELEEEMFNEYSEEDNHDDSY